VNSSSKFAWFGIAVGSLLLACACGSREHMNPEHGQRSRFFFAKQHVYAQASTGSPSGVDSEEAAVIQDNYRKALGAQQPNTDQNAPSRVLLLREPANGKPMGQ
jgi:hypothetical protein